MRNLKSRIDRIEKRVAIDEKPMLTWEELHHYWRLEHPEEFRQGAVDPASWCHDIAKHIEHCPTPKRVLRLYRLAQLGLIKRPWGHVHETAHTEDDSPRPPEDPEEKHEL